MTVLLTVSYDFGQFRSLPCGNSTILLSFWKQCLVCSFLSNTMSATDTDTFGPFLPPVFVISLRLLCLLEFNALFIWTCCLVVILRRLKSVVLFIFCCRKFRIIPADVFLSTFASDRSHMKKPSGEWIKEPPPYRPIRTAGNSCFLNFILWSWK